jgi:ubiquinone/menaquinone biosynthesis C-methylase UbiE
MSRQFAAEPAKSATGAPQARALSEIRRLNAQHAAWRQIIQGNYRAPLTQPTAILDVGCGTGRWAMEMSQEFPAAMITAFDIVPQSPSGSLGNGIDVIPRNVRFQLADATRPLSYPDAAFDYVHLQLLYGDLPASAWAPLLREVVRVTHPGGWIESIESVPFPNGHKPSAAVIIGWHSEVLRRQGADPMIALKFPTLMHECGIQAITRYHVNQTRYVPELVEQRRASALHIIEITREPAVAFGITTAAEYDRTAAEAQHELTSGLLQGDFLIYIALGQRPAH